jgi:hypothetical protein
MAKASQYTTSLEDAITDIKASADKEYTTRAEMESALDTIVDLCVEALPDLDEDADDEDADDSDGE